MMDSDVKPTPGEFHERGPDDSTTPDHNGAFSTTPSNTTASAVQIKDG